MSNLYIVSTPIGNLSDLSSRAVETLRAVQKVMAEDTRRTAILFKHYGISTPLYSAHEHNEAARVAQILSWLSEGQDLAIVSDAGTPLLSDPGARIVQAVVEAGHDVIPIPGASALLAALVASGMEPEPFTFFGFLARSGRERTSRLAEIATIRHTVVLYEAPGRIAKTLEDLAAVCGDERRVAVGREITKLHEEFVRGNLREVHEHFDGETVKGEIVVVLEGAPEVKAESLDQSAEEMARGLLQGGESPSAVAKQVAKAIGISRNRAYEITQEIANE